MANSSPNLKVNIGADTSQFTKGVKEARRELKDFEKVGSDALSSVGDALGVNTGKLEQLASAARGMGNRMKESSSESVQALGSILTKINGVTTAVAGIGIAAAVASFKLLNEEATWFKNTIEGANIEMATAAYVKAYSDTLHGFNTATGKSVAEIGSELKKGLSTAWSTIKSAAMSTMTGGSPAFGTALAGMVPQIMAAVANAEEAERISNQIFEINKKILEQSVQTAKVDAQIAELRRTATDPLESAATRLAAINQATALIKSKYEGPDGLISLNEQLSSLQKAMYDLPGSGMKDLEALTNQQKAVLALSEQESNELRTLQKTQKTLNAEVAKEAAERTKAMEAAAAAAKAIADSRDALAALDLSTSGSLAGFLPEGITGADGGLTIPVKLVAEEESWKEMESLVAGFVESTAASIGQLVGDLATGGNAWGNFKNAALSAFADMAIAVGKLAISTGVATIGIKKALESLNGYVAIAAGVALVALGSAVKAGLANISSGDYSASASVASASYGSGRSSADAWTARALTVQVEGKLTADGDQLTAVINNTNKRNSHTT